MIIKGKSIKINHKKEQRETSHSIKLMFRKRISTIGIGLTSLYMDKRRITKDESALLREIAKEVNKKPAWPTYRPFVRLAFVRRD